MVGGNSAGNIWGVVGIVMISEFVQVVKNLWHFVYGWYWVIRCGYPAKHMKVVGVTGTDGKTTTTTIIYETLKAAGISVGMLSTVSAKYCVNGDEHEIDTGLHTTNPGPEILQPILARMKALVVTHVILEVTSHGLDQSRVVGCNFLIGVLTNITHEHLDYHKTMERYVLAKQKLFEMVRVAVLNKDESVFKQFSDVVTSRGGRVVAYGKLRGYKMADSLLGDYNLYNAAAALGVINEFGIERKIFESVIKSFTGVPGRREEVDMGQKYRVVVDFAHTPNALGQVLSQLKKELGTNGRLIAVFGATGERDKKKRPVMGKIAAKYGDLIVVTADDTRSERQTDIADQIMSDLTVSEKRKFVREDDRALAITHAISRAGVGDIVLLAGKGHEKSLLIGKVEKEWSDVEQAKKAIKSLLAK